MKWLDVQLLCVKCNFRISYKINVKLLKAAIVRNIGGAAVKSKKQTPFIVHT